MTTPWHSAPWTPREWQAEALPRVMRAMKESNPVLRAVTGAGKSILLAEVAHQVSGKVVVTTPTVKLVDQLTGTLKARGLEVGRFFTRAKQTRHDVIVCCNDSLASLSERIDPPKLWIVDECHKSECDQVKDVILGPQNLDGSREETLAWKPTYRLGCTATPYRADKSEELSLFDHLAYDYGPAQAIKDGVVVPPRVRHYRGSSKSLDDACLEMISGATGPGIVDSINIKDAREFADYLSDNGVRAQAVHSKLAEVTVKKRLKRLEEGRLDAIVHVSLLSEGVDLPWLRWLCCRRPISSRTLFAQYIGRGLRTHPGKDYCVVFDPQDLFGQLSLDYEAILGGGGEEDEEVPELPALELDWIVDEIRENPAHLQETLSGVPVKVIDPAVSYIRRTRLAFQSMGLCDMKIGDSEWRKESPTDQQLRRISKNAWLVNEPEVPSTHSRALRIAIRAIEGCDRGTASDLISILNVLSYGWPKTEGEQAA